jgi:hypothetical protein
MRVALTIETSVGITDEKTNLIINLSNKLSEYFLDKDYGGDVKVILIRIICVAPEFDWFSTIRKPRYKFYGKHIRDGVEIIEDRLFSFSLKIDYENFKNQSDEQNEQMLASEILESLSNLDSLPKKVKDFDKVQFKEDMKIFFDEQRLLVKNNERVSFI